MGFPGGTSGKESAFNTGDMGSIPRSGRSPGVEHGNPLQSSFFFFPRQYSCLQNPHRGAWQATVYRVAQSWTWLKWLSTHTHTRIYKAKKVHSCQELQEPKKAAQDSSLSLWRKPTLLTAWFQISWPSIGKRMNFLIHWCFKPPNL